jgi:hypothetical protein
MGEGGGAKRVTQVLKAAIDIAEGSMAKLLELEDKPKKGKERHGYTGVAVQE